MDFLSIPNKVSEVNMWHTDTRNIPDVTQEASFIFSLIVPFLQINNKQQKFNNVKKKLNFFVHYHFIFREFYSPYSNTITYSIIKKLDHYYAMGLDVKVRDMLYFFYCFLGSKNK